MVFERALEFTLVPAHLISAILRPQTAIHRHVPCVRLGFATGVGPLLALELGLALLDICFQAFLRIVALEKELLQLALDTKRLSESDL